MLLLEGRCTAAAGGSAACSGVQTPEGPHASAYNGRELRCRRHREGEGGRVSETLKMIRVNLK